MSVSDAYQVRQVRGETPALGGGWLLHPRERTRWEPCGRQTRQGYFLGLTVVRHRLAWDVGAMVANVPVAYSVRERLRNHYGQGTRVVSILVRNSSPADLTEGSTSQVVESGERKRIDYPGGAEFVSLKADAATLAGEVTADVEVEAP